MLAGGAPLEQVAAVLGHASIVVTKDVYGHLLPDAQARPTAALAARLLADRASTVGRQA